MRWFRFPGEFLTNIINCWEYVIKLKTFFQMMWRQGGWNDMRVTTETPNYPWQKNWNARLEDGGCSNLTINETHSASQSYRITRGLVFPKWRQQAWFEMCFVSQHPYVPGAGCKTRLESRIKEVSPRFYLWWRRVFISKKNQKRIFWRIILDYFSHPFLFMMGVHKS